ncbi:MAG TPA: isoaspartyl peptidase/L-asparaginase [Terriglobales bacterium]|nr:isoaspartyl peptidase/L-asparaginase [Terriglobales bacterium]
MSISRRDFLASTLAGSLALGRPRAEASQQASARLEEPKRAAKLPILVCSSYSHDYLEKGYQMLAGGADTLDAALQVIKGPEDDPNAQNVGLGGRPNEEGVVELDACCMHGPTRTAGAVAGVRNIKNVSLLSNTVRLHTGHVLLVGEGAERFAVAQGFPRENLLTEKSRKDWLLWKETHSDWWGPGIASPDWRRRFRPPAHAEEWQLRIQRMQEIAAGIGIPPEDRAESIFSVIYPPTGTTHCSALNEKGEMSGCTTTSGLAWKIPGRVGDSAIIGAGCYTDQDVGSAGAIGSGEENIKIAGAHTIVENMRHGMSPLEAGMDALRRIVRNYNGDRERLQFMDMVYYILRKDGAYAGVSLWEGYFPDEPHQIAVHDGTRRLENTVYIFAGASHDWPPRASAS